ncbi:uncharacterized protein LOC143143112 isoform X4 [Ptiloglossa arizonensis]
MYEGDWLDGKRHGFGVLSKISENGTLRQRYTGDWVAGKKNGFGRSWYEDGSYYEGDFCQNKRQGYGRIWYCNGDYYEGTWFNNLYDGMGMFVKANGNRYEGQFVKGKKEGRGTFYHIITGQEQRGFWSNDTCTNGTISDLYWRQSAPRPTPYPIPRVHATMIITIISKILMTVRLLTVHIFACSVGRMNWQRMTMKPKLRTKPTMITKRQILCITSTLARSHRSV